MWIVFFNNTPSFWLIGGEVYRAGKKDCHMVIKDDRSISRTHVSIEVGLAPVESIDGPPSTSQAMPAPLTLIDSSTYGTVVFPCGQQASSSSVSPTHQPSVERDTGIIGLQYVHSSNRPLASSEGRIRAPSSSTDVVGLGEQHTLVKGTPFRVPVDRADWTEFSVVLGNHGATLTLLWADITAVVERVDKDYQTKLEHQLNKCGVRPLYMADRQFGAEERAARLAAADFLITDMLQPSAAAFAMLCRAVPVVRPAYFAAVKDRLSPQVPLPDPQQYTPPLDPIWDALLQASCGASAGDKDVRRLLAPHPQRQRLFAGITFVVVQAALYDETRQYIECAAGRVVLDESLTGIVNAETKESLLTPFLARHSQRVVLYNEQDRMPFRDCMQTLRSDLRMSCIEYGKVIESILLAEPLELQPFPSTTEALPTSGRSTRGGRQTEGEPLFPSMNQLGGGDNAALGPGEEEEVALNLHRHVSADGWISRSGENQQGGGGVGNSRKRTHQELLVTRDAATASWHRLQLPQYPCFTPHGGSAPDEAPTSSAASPMKRFKKQHIATASGPPVELDDCYKTRAAADLLSSRVPQLDEDDIVPERAAVLRHGGNKSFNPAATAIGPSTTQQRGSHALPAGARLAGVQGVVAAFNAFDTAAHHASGKKKGTAKATTRKKQTAAPSGRRRAAAAEEAETTADTSDMLEDVSPDGPAEGGGGGGAFNIFDIEGLF